MEKIVSLLHPSMVALVALCAFLTVMTVRIHMRVHALHKKPLDDSYSQLREISSAKSLREFFRKYLLEGIRNDESLSGLRLRVQRNVGSDALRSQILSLLDELDSSSYSDSTKKIKKLDALKRRMHRVMRAIKLDSDSPEV